MTQPIPPMCPSCGAPMNVGELACARCGALYYRDRLDMLAREATALEAVDPQRAAGVWEQCLPLLPQNSQQFAHIWQRVSALRGPVLSYAPSSKSPRFDPWPVAIAKTGGSMVVSIVVYRMLFGSWVLSIGFVMLILVHEMGHVIANVRYNLRSSPPIFIPFLGAVIVLREGPKDAKIEAISGIAGPIAGTIAALACAIWYVYHPSPMALRLAWFGFAINLYNMLPVPPLDGGRVTAAMSPWIWIAGLAGLGWLVVSDYRAGRDFSILVILLIIALPRIIATLKGGLRSGPYYQIGRVAPIVIGAVYLALLGLLVAGRWWTEKKLGLHGAL